MTKLEVTPMDPQGLYQLHQYTDDKAGTILEKLPVTIVEGHTVPDPVRLTTYSGQCYINGQQLNFPIPALSLTEAVEFFKSSCEGLIEELQSQAIQAHIAANGRQASGLLIDQPPRKR
jgi:hypothetical protein